MLIVDAHLDLAMNALEWNRDLRQPLDQINKRETGQKDKADRGHSMVSFEELRKGNVGLVVATQIARYVSASNPLPGWHSSEQAWAHTQGQLAWYKTMEAVGELTMIKNKEDLHKHLKYWNDPIPTNNKKTIGYIVSLEGADSIVDISYVQKAYEYGLRAIGPAHYGPGRYANGTDSTGHLHQDGKDLLHEMQRLNMILDATHLCDDAFWDAMDIYGGPVWASHNNCRSLVHHNRQFSDDMIKILLEKKAVIGAVFDAWMIVPDWIRGKSDPKIMNCNLERLVDHIVHICTLAGNTNHIGVGSDLDGGYGTEQSPYDIRTIADLQLIPGILGRRGFTNTEIEGMMHGNWLGFLDRVWGE